MFDNKLPKDLVETAMNIALNEAQDTSNKTMRRNIQVSTEPFISPEAGYETVKQITQDVPEISAFGVNYAWDKYGPNATKPPKIDPNLFDIEPGKLTKLGKATKAVKPILNLLAKGVAAPIGLGADLYGVYRDLSDLGSREVGNLPDVVKGARSIVGDDPVQRQVMRGADKGKGSIQSQRREYADRVREDPEWAKSEEAKKMFKRLAAGTAWDLEEATIDDRLRDKHHAGLITDPRFGFRRMRGQRRDHDRRVSTVRERWQFGTILDRAGRLRDHTRPDPDEELAIVMADNLGLEGSEREEYLEQRRHEASQRRESATDPSTWSPDRERRAEERRLVRIFSKNFGRTGPPEPVRKKY